jgi:hypothetical protein
LAATKFRHCAWVCPVIALYAFLTKNTGFPQIYDHISSSLEKIRPSISDFRIKYC